MLDIGLLWLTSTLDNFSPYFTSNRQVVGSRSHRMRQMNASPADVISRLQNRQLHLN